jgi:hypothetical protein
MQGGAKTRRIKQKHHHLARSGRGVVGGRGGEGHRLEKRVLLPVWIDFYRVRTRQHSSFFNPCHGGEWSFFEWSIQTLARSMQPKTMIHKFGRTNNFYLAMDTPLANKILPWTAGGAEMP